MQDSQRYAATSVPHCLYHELSKCVTSSVFCDCIRWDLLSCLSIASGSPQEAPTPSQHPLLRLTIFCFLKPMPPLVALFRGSMGCFVQPRKWTYFPVPLQRMSIEQCIESCRACDTGYATVNRRHGACLTLCSMSVGVPSFTSIHCILHVIGWYLMAILPGSSCPENGTEFEDQCYFLDPTPSSERLELSEAISICDTLWPNSELVSVASELVEQFILQHLGYVKIN